MKVRCGRRLEDWPSIKKTSGEKLLYLMFQCSYVKKYCHVKGSIRQIPQLSAQIMYHALMYNALKDASQYKAATPWSIQNKIHDSPGFT